MVDLAPFRGLRYAGGTDLAAVTAPPYDAIDDALAGRLRQRHPHNVVRLERGAGTGRGGATGRGAGTGRGGETGRGAGTGRSAGGRGGGGPEAGAADPYERVADTYRRWLDEGVLEPDPSPCLYVYEETFREGGRAQHQRGVLAALRLRPWEEREVLPHERIFRAPVEDRLHLMEALPANTSPVFCLAPREPPEVEAVLDTVMHERPIVRFQDPDGVRHRMWVVPGRDVHATIAEGYRDVTLLMADGHHRYTTALEFLDRHGGVPGADRILTYVVGGDGPVIRPSHRVVRGALGDITARIGGAGLTVDRAPSADGSDDGPGRVRTAVARASAALDRLRGAGFVAVTRGGPGDVRVSVVRETDPEAGERLRAATGADPAARHLDVALLHGALTAGLEVDVGADPVDIVPDTAEAIGAVVEGRATAAFLVRPVDVGQVRGIAEAGGRMPPKSTSFHPKPRTGLVIRGLHDDVHA